MIKMRRFSLNRRGMGIKMRIKGAIFDMDGTMFDSEQLSVLGWTKASEEMGFEIPMDFMLSCMGLPANVIAQMFVERYGKDFDYQNFRDRKITHMTAVIERDGVPVKPGLFELLDHLHAKQIPCAVATSTSEERAMYMLNTAGVKGYFQAIICGDMIENGKPAPDIYLKAAEALALDPADCMALEDSRNGIISASRAGMKAVLIPDMIPADDEMRAAAYAMVESLHDVVAMVE